MSYIKTNWQNLPNTSTPIIANSLNNIENGVADANGAIAVNTYSSSSTYEVGDYCIYNNKLYKCTTAISTAEAFNSTKWQQIKIAEEINNTGVTVSPTEPTGNNKNKVWFKRGKNLFDKNLIVSTSDAIKYIPVKVKKNTDYTLSTNSGTNSLANVFLTTSASGASTANNGAMLNNPRTVNSENNDILYVGYRTDLSSYWIQLEQGSSATSYEAYIKPTLYTKNNNNVYEEFTNLELSYKEYAVELSANENVPPYNAFGIYTIPKTELDAYGEIVSISAKNSTAAPISCTWKKNTNGTVSVYVCGWSSIGGNTIRVTYLKNALYSIIS